MSPPTHSEGYRRGYLCGIIRGDGNLATYPDKRPSRAGAQLHRFRLALVDLEGLVRTREYLADRSVATDRFVFAAPTDARREMQAIRTQSASGVAAIREVTAWPRRPDRGWMLGFLAGIFDAEGSFGQVIRIANGDPKLIDWVCWCLRELSFTHVVERYPDRVSNVRLTGGLGSVMRFFS